MPHPSPGPLTKPCLYELRHHTASSSRAGASSLSPTPYLHPRCPSAEGMNIPPVGGTTPPPDPDQPLSVRARRHRSATQSPPRHQHRTPSRRQPLQRSSSACQAPLAPPTNSIRRSRAAQEILVFIRCHCRSTGHTRSRPAPSTDNSHRQHRPDPTPQHVARAPANIMLLPRTGTCMRAALSALPYVPHMLHAWAPWSRMERQRVYTFTTATARRWWPTRAGRPEHKHAHACVAW